jgi:hypothetical protein
VDYYTVNIDGKDYICIAATEDKSDDQWEIRERDESFFPLFFFIVIPEEKKFS